MRTQSSTAALAAVVLCSVVLSSPSVQGSLAPWGKSAGLYKFHNNLFGLSSSSSSSSTTSEFQRSALLSTRGGSTKAAPDEDAAEEEAPVELYLPGLLDAVVSAADLVRNTYMLLSITSSKRHLRHSPVIRQQRLSMFLWLR